MATTAPDMLSSNANEALPSLAVVRRLEAVGFRSFPAGRVVYDGAWALRLTDGMGSKRLNSLNPLDPGDRRDVAVRLAAARTVFEKAGRPFCVRTTPLCPPELTVLLNEEGWRRFDESCVMGADLKTANLTCSEHVLPTNDIARFVQACLAMGSVSPDHAAGLGQLIGAVEGRVGLFITQDVDGTPKAALMAVLFADMLGLLQVVSNPHKRRQGHGRAVVRSAMAWGKDNGARSAWLQVEATNEAACRLYESEGFAEIYRYDYCTPPKQADHG